MENKLNKKRGRPPGDHELRKVRSSVWYKAVKSVGDHSDTQLDVLFGKSEDGLPRNTGDRFKIFEAIRVNRSLPNIGVNNRRNYDLVAFVNSHLGYCETAAIFHSPLWKLFDKNQPSVKEIREIVVQCILELSKLNYELGYIEDEKRDFLTPADYFSSDLFFESYEKFDENYYKALTSAFKSMDSNLSYITLLGALSFEAIAGGNIVIAINLMKLFRIHLKEYCEQDWLGTVGKELYALANKRILEVFNKNNIDDLESYISILSKLSNANIKILNSPLANFLQMHESMIWRKH